MALRLRDQRFERGAGGRRAVPVEDQNRSLEIGERGFHGVSFGPWVLRVEVAVTVGLGLLAAME